MKKLLIAALLAIASLNIQAQGLKLAYTNVEFILESHPKMKEIQSEIETLTNVYRKDIQTKTQEFQAKVAQYQKGEAMMSDIVKADKQKELQDTQNSIEDMQSNAQMKLMQKQEALLAPVLDEIEAAIEAVAKTNGYDYVFNGSTSNGTSIVLYAKSKGDNLTIKIFEKLGIPISEELKKELEQN